MHPRDRKPPTPATAAEQEHEAEASWPLIGAGPVTRSMVKGATLWTAIGVAAGAVLGALLAFIPIGDTSWTMRLVLFAVVGALAGATAGVLYGGGRQPEVDEEVGNQARGAPLREENREPTDARRYVEQAKRARRDPRRSPGMG
jgi:hypothetical protein